MGAVSSKPGGPREPARLTYDDELDMEKKRRPQFREWTVLSSGPSIKQLERSDLPAEPPLICVNHAQQHIRGDVWCVHENNQGIWESLIIPTAGPLPEKVGETWVAHGHVDVWNTVVRAQRSHERRQELDIVGHPNRPRDWWYHKVPWPGSKVIWGTITVLAAIGHAIMRGAERIEAYGVDMEGAANSAGHPATAEQRRVGDGKPWTERWDRERSMWDLMVKESAEHGVEVKRMTT